MIEMMEVTLKAYQVIEKTARAAGTSAHIFVPKEWAGKKVRVFLLEEATEKVKPQNRRIHRKDKNNPREPTNR